MSIREEFLAQFTPLPEGLTLPPELLEACEVESCLARKGEGGVWRLRRRDDGALLVLKAVPVGEEDLAGEYEILARLVPLLPGAVPVPQAHFRAGALDCLVRTYLPGETLEDYREREGGCSEEVCVRVGRQVCALLGALHRQDPPMIHRDIKPEHIILLPDGGVGLIDFGIARQYKEDQDTDTRRMGSRATAAPEQYGYAQTDRRTDLYALGMTLIWLCTGQYDRESLAASGCSPGLRRTLEKATAFSPQARFQDAAAFSAALAGRGARRRLAWGAAALIGVLLLTGGALWLGRQGETAPTAQTAPPLQSALPTPAPQAVSFTSRTMEAAVRQALDRPEGAITYDDLAGITRLAAVGENTFGEESVFDYRVSCFIDNQFQGDLPLGDITDADLALLAHMPNLETLYLCRQEVKDISVLEGLPLTTLALCEDKILDLSPLGTLTELETLYLGGNPGTDYSALSDLARLETLRVEGSGSTGLLTVDSLTFLDGLAPRKLGLGLVVPRDGDWTPLTRQVALEDLSLWDPPEAAVAAANTLTSLKILSFGDYFVPDLTALNGLSSLEALNIHKGGLESLEGVEALPRLISLSVGFNGVTDLTPLVGLDRLNYLQMEDLAITDFSPLLELPALGYVVVPQAQAAAVEADCPGYTFELRTY